MIKIKKSIENIKERHLYERPKIRKEAKRVIIAVTLGAILLTFKMNFGIAVPSGISMLPNFKEDNLYLMSKNFNPKRGDSVMMTVRIGREDEHYMKRIVGVPGDTISIKNQKIYLNGELFREDYVLDGIQANAEDNKEIIVGDGEYLLLGDNRENSFDGRNFGVVTEDALNYKILFRLFKLSDFIKI
ncbi:MAG: signal peptidase I [Peptostreptococcaceae bacterium]